MSDLKEGTKFDSEKPRLELFSPVAMEEICKVLTFGAKKYEPYNWAKGIKYTRVLGGVLRHIYAYMRGENLDPETGISHLAHASCGLMFILHYEKFRSEFDDRPVQAYTKFVPQSNVIQLTNETKKEVKE